MRKIYSICIGGFTLLTTASLAIAGSGEDGRLVMPRSVQGTDYASTLRRSQSEGIRKNSATPAFEWVVPDDIGMPDGQFTFDDIDNWTGEGENRAALVIQWNDDDEQTAMVFGYRWDGMATGADMLKAVVEANPRLYTLMQYTNVSSPTDPDGGYTICGLGWDRDNDGDIRLIDIKNNEEYTSESGFFRHPRSYDPINDYGGTSDYDYDNWKACDDDDFWGGGWYENYWSYWVKSGDGATFSYSNWGASGRVLENDCWDGWKYAKNMNSQGAWKPFVTAPNLNANPDDLIWEEDNLVYRVTNVTLHSVALCSPAALGQEAYSGNLVIPSSVTHDGEEYRVTGVDERACQDAEIGTVTLPGGIRSIGNYAFAGSNVENITCGDYDDTFHIVPSIIYIGEGAFKDCAALSTYIIGNNKIAPHTYAGTAITEVVVPTAATSLTSDMFAGCKDVKNVRVYSSVPLSIAEDVFEPEVYTEATLLVPEDGLEAYKNDAVWSKFTNIATTSAPLNVGDQFCYNNIYYKVTSAEPGNLTVEVQPASWDGIQWPQGWYDKTAHANNVKYKGELTVPELVPYKDREFIPTSVADFAFYGISNVMDDHWNEIAPTVVSVPSSIKKAGQRAFMFCTNLTRIPAELEEVGESAFEGANILDSTFPTGLKSVGNRAFMSAKTQNEIALDLSQATKIGELAFYGLQGLQLVKFGPVISTIGESAFEWCPNLTEVVLDENMVDIPDNAFKGITSLQSVKLSDNVTSIGNQAFYNCTNLRYLNYYEAPDSNNSEGAQKLPSTLRKLGDHAFFMCPISFQSFPETLEYLGEGNYLDAKNIVLDASVTEISDEMFKDMTQIESITLSDKVTYIGEYAFYGCSNLKFINILEDPENWNKEGAQPLPAALNSIGDSAFARCEKLNISELPEGLAYLGEYLFYDNQTITEFRIPVGVKSIPVDMFLYCRNLKTITLSNGVEEIGEQAFYGCNNLKFINILEDPENWNKEGAQPLPASLNTIGRSAFVSCSSLNLNILPENLREIGDRAFSYMDAVECLQFPEGITYIGENAFDGCPNLTEVVLDKNMVDIPDNAFKSITSLQSVKLSDNVTSIGNQAFYNCTNLRYLNYYEVPESYDSEGAQKLPSTLRKLGDYAFFKCPISFHSFPETLEYLGEGNYLDAKNIVLDASVTEISNEMFKDMTQIESITLSDKVTYIGDQAFCGCTNLKFINILEDPENWNKEGAQPLPASLNSIGRSAFVSCSSLNLDILPENLREIGEQAFYYMDAVECLQFPEGITYIPWCIDTADNLKRVVVPSTCQDGDFFNFGSRLLSVYLCGMEPSFDLIITEGDEVIGRVIVPTGCKEAYINGNGYADYNPETPVITDVILDSPVADCEIVKADYEVSYKEELPLLFAVANRKALAANAEVTFEVYTVSDEMVSREGVEPVAKGVGRFNENGLLEAEMPSALSTGNYRICWTISADGNTVTTPMEEFAYTGTVKVAEIGSDATAISAENGMIRFKGMAGREFSVFDMSGKSIAAFTVQSDDFTLPLRLETGIYMVVSRDAKIATKVKL